MSNNQQFSGYASALFDDLDPMFNNFMVERADCDYVTASRTAQGIREYLAQAAYDLVEHTLAIVPHLLEVARDAEHVSEVMKYVPDMPELPEETNE